MCCVDDTIHVSYFPLQNVPWPSSVDSSGANLIGGKVLRLCSRLAKSEAYGRKGVIACVQED